MGTLDVRRFVAAFGHDGNQFATFFVCEGYGMFIHDLHSTATRQPNLVRILVALCLEIPCPIVYLILGKLSVVEPTLLLCSERVGWKLCHLQTGR